MNDQPPPQNRTSFCYQPLDPQQGEIRLIEIEPLTQKNDMVEGGNEGLVRCSLKHIRLSDAARYRALSYAWGDPNITKAIVLDGRQVDVTSNPESVLRELAIQRSRDPEITPALWVDAVCIDQQNETERTHQVSRMDMIYRSATQTLIWLGRSTHDSRLAMDSLLSLSRVVRGLAQHFSSWSMFPFEHVARARKAARLSSQAQSASPQTGQNTGLAILAGLDVSKTPCHAARPPTKLKPDQMPNTPWVSVVLEALDSIIDQICSDDSAILRAIASLFERPWFRRVWVIQERTLSRDSMVTCGTDWIYWTKLYDGFWLLCGVRDYLDIVGSDTGRSDSAALAALLTTALDRVTPVAFARPATPLISLLSMLSRNAARTRLEASDPRDYVFAFLGLVDPATSPRIRVDYTKDWATVRVEVARACLAHYGPAVLAFAGLLSVSGDLAPPAEGARVPSWAPDWSSEQLSQPLYIPSIFMARGADQKRAYAASRDLMQSLSNCFTADHRLSLYASRLDDVAEPGEPLPETAESADDTARVASLAAWVWRLEAILPWVNEVYQTPWEVREALWKTPIADREFLHNWETERASAEMFSAYLAIRVGNVSEGVKYASVARTKLHRRRPFRSVRGYIGLGPLATAAGDSVWVIPGADAPFILRPKEGGGFLIVGEAHVHGIMNGEFAELEERLQKIELS
ncbi:heterokaryon incompatibility protein [Colletotrichum sojae]|uniref:Heterokaryon incompatibility protein n=1 Tax=Colletotrichum sojae TaxID=2175907 RepID=A0A8H6MNS4_9PEZI|nr:heterokaryon incompatibility protein [Colletotrichum sojae]